MLIYDILYKTFMGSIPLRIRLDKVDCFIKIFDQIGYLVLLGHSCYDEICDGIKYLVREKKVVLQIALIIILESEWIYIIHYL